MSKEEFRTPARLAFEAQASDPSYKFKMSRKGVYINPALARDWKWFQAGVKYAELRESPGGASVQPGTSEGVVGAADQHDPNRPGA